jgi:hypothetical protein
MKVGKGQPSDRAKRRQIIEHTEVGPAQGGGRPVGSTST